MYKYWYIGLTLYSFETKHARTHARTDRWRENRYPFAHSLSLGEVRVTRRRWTSSRVESSRLDGLIVDD